MNPWSTRQQIIWARLADRIDDAEMARLDAFNDAFDRLYALDKALAQLAIEAFCDRDIAVDGMARRYAALSGINAYGCLAAGRRESVARWLRGLVADNR